MNKSLMANEKRQDMYGMRVNDSGEWVIYHAMICNNINLHGSQLGNTLTSFGLYILYYIYMYAPEYHF